MWPRNRTWAWFALAVTAALYGVLSLTGLSWGLPSQADDAVLFGLEEAGEPPRPDAEEPLPSSGGPGADWEHLPPGAARHDPDVGADVDVNPLNAAGPVPLTAAPEDVAEIYRRYRLFTRQPDEMITMMALSGMNPRAGRLDPKLYQYGGLFIYPVGGIVGACGAVGIFPVRSDLGYYLEHPNDFGKFYLAARAYTAAWGLLGMLLMYALARRLGGTSAGLIAALLFVLLPVVVSMAHEAKPHLPGAVLMLLSVWLTGRLLERPSGRRWLALAVSCGAALGMVLSAAPVLVLIPLAAALELRGRRSLHGVDTARSWLGAFGGRCAVFGGVAVLTYLVANPYIVINGLTNPAVLRSNFGNSLTMYAVDQVGAGLVRAIQLSAEGATWPVLVLGVVAAALALRARRGDVLPLLASAGVLLVQFMLIGAGKPDEYGRFGVFHDCALAIGAAAVLGWLICRRRLLGALAAIIVCAVCAWSSGGYLYNLQADATQRGSRDLAAAYLAGNWPDAAIAVIAEPAPYACPPMDFAHRQVTLFRAGPTATPLDGVRAWNAALRGMPRGAGGGDVPRVLVAAVDDPAAVIQAVKDRAWRKSLVFEARHPWLPRGRITWANKPIIVLLADPL